jgi:hypothetical protein
MESEGSCPISINQIALEQAIPEGERETFRENQRRRGFRLVTDLKKRSVRGKSLQSFRKHSRILRARRSKKASAHKRSGKPEI